MRNSLLALIRSLICVSFVVAGGCAEDKASRSREVGDFFGADGRSTLNGVIFPLTPGALTGAFDGIGTGAVTVRNGSGDSCAATSFSWMVFPQL